LPILKKPARVGLAILIELAFIPEANVPKETIPRMSHLFMDTLLFVVSDIVDTPLLLFIRISNNTPPAGNYQPSPAL
jgi:hypothetical protein